MQSVIKSGATRILSAGHVRVNRERAPALGEPECEGAARVETREHGGVIREIVITCTCGETIILHCDYGAK